MDRSAFTLGERLYPDGGCLLPGLSSLTDQGDGAKELHLCRIAAVRLCIISSVSRAIRALACCAGHAAGPDAAIRSNHPLSDRFQRAYPVSRHVRRSRIGWRYSGADHGAILLASSDDCGRQSDLRADRASILLG